MISDKSGKTSRYKTNYKLQVKTIIIQENLIRYLTTHWKNKLVIKENIESPRTNLIENHIGGVRKEINIKKNLA